MRVEAQVHSGEGDADDLSWGGGVAYVLHSVTTGKKLVTVQHLNSSPLPHFQQFKSSDI